MSEEPQKFALKVERDKDYKRIHAHGVLVFVRHDGEFSLEFYEDIESLAKGFYIDQDKGVKVIEPNENQIRQHKVGISLVPDAVHSLIQNLLAQYKAIHGEFPKFEGMVVEEDE